jgi:hypothetical protein
MYTIAIASCYRFMSSARRLVHGTWLLRRRRRSNPSKAPRTEGVNRTETGRTGKQTVNRRVNRQSTERRSAVNVQPSAVDVNRLCGV